MITTQSHEGERLPFLCCFFPQEKKLNLGVGLITGRDNGLIIAGQLAGDTGVVPICWPHMGKQTSGRDGDGGKGGR